MRNVLIALVQAGYQVEHKSKDRVGSMITISMEKDNHHASETVSTEALLDVTKYNDVLNNMRMDLNLEISEGLLI